MKLLLSTLVLVPCISILTYAANNSHGTGGKKGANLDLFPTKAADSAKSKAPAKPKLLEPAFNAQVTAGTTTLKWESVPTATSYHLQVATDPNFKWLITDNWNHTSTSFEQNGPEKGKSYFWRVAAMKSDNVAGKMKGWFAVNSFAVK